jgi:hypothetical protein
VSIGGDKRRSGQGVGFEANWRLKRGAGIEARRVAGESGGAEEGRVGSGGVEKEQQVINEGIVPARRLHATLARHRWMVL